ncbi:MAG TPA: hypothetical protein VF894_15690 [Anaeromyxobacter sp.]
MSASRHIERGAALLIVMVSVAVLTAFAVDLAYDARVSLQIAANARDELRASYLARSGVGMTRLVLSFQQQLDDAVPKGAGMQLPRIQLWRLVALGAPLTDGLFGGGPPPAAHGAAPGASPPATYAAQVDDEGRKVNAQLEAINNPGLLLAPQVQAIYQLVCDPRWDPLFEREDTRGGRTTREELLVRLRDWVDEDDRSSGLRATFGGASCSMVSKPPPFEDAFGDENQPYDRGEDRYRAKNARMDSLEELYLVAGIGDAFMAAFGDQLTVYLPRDAHRNVNELDRRRLVELAKIIADPPGQPLLFDPTFGERLQKLIVERTLGGILSYGSLDFGQAVEACGVHVNQTLLQESNPNNPFTDRSTTFSIRSTGTAGTVKTALEVVVRMEKPAQGEAVAAPGRVIHWREE